MALSNLIWWPWFGIGGAAPPVVAEYNPIGDITPASVQGRGRGAQGPPVRGMRKRLTDEEEELIYLITEL